MTRAEKPFVISRVTSTDKGGMPVRKATRLEREREAKLIQDYLLTGKTDKVSKLPQKRLLRDHCKNWEEKVEKIEKLLKRLPNTEKTNTREQMARQLDAQVNIYYLERRLETYRELYKEIYDSKAWFEPKFWLRALGDDQLAQLALDDLYDIIIRLARPEAFKNEISRAHFIREMIKKGRPKGSKNRSPEEKKLIRKHLIQRRKAARTGK
jgi:hypothetical protein